MKEKSSLICFAIGCLKANEDFVFIGFFDSKGLHRESTYSCCASDESAVCQAAIYTDYIIKGDATLGKRAGHAWRHWMTSKRQANSKGKRKENTDLRSASLALFVI